MCTIHVNGQQNIYNAGNLKLHSKGSLGFHTGLINEGNFNENKGMIGFYDQDITISGSETPSFYDLEVAVEHDLFITTSIEIENSLNFIYGNIVAPRSNKNVYVKLNPKAFIEGEGSLTKIDGHAATIDQKEFTFPIGYGNKYRPLQIRFIDGTFLARCEYYHEDPSNPESIYERYDTSRKASTIGEINPEEFWNLTTSGVIQIAVNLDPDHSRTPTLDNVEQQIIVGWSKEEKKWLNLGNSGHSSSLGTSSIMSNPFNANNFEIFTTAMIYDTDEILPGNYVLSPNADGINDMLKFEIVNRSQNNHLLIFDRTGKIVYEKSDYQNDFKGIANKSSAGKNKLLEKGTYFYLLELKDLNMKHQGYFYINR